MRCFISLKNQSYGFENLEIIFVDDLSTDNTWSVLQSIQMKYPDNVVACQLQTKGHSGGARNLGMDFCSSKYFTFVDADDWIHPNMLEIMYTKMLETDSDIVQCGYMNFRDELPSQNLYASDFDYEILYLEDINVRKNHINALPGVSNLVVWGKLFSTDFIKRNHIRFLENVYYEDNCFSFLCAVLARKVCKIKLNLYGYFSNDAGTVTNRMNFDRIHDLKYNMDCCRKELKERRLDETIGKTCKAEIELFLFWKEYVETLTNLETAYNREIEFYKSEALKENPDILNNAYVRNFTNENIMRKVELLSR